MTNQECQSCFFFLIRWTLCEISGSDLEWLSLYGSICWKDSIEPIVSLCDQWRLWSDCAFADLSHRKLHMSKGPFSHDTARMVQSVNWSISDVLTGWVESAPSEGQPSAVRLHTGFAIFYLLIYFFYHFIFMLHPHYRYTSESDLG